MVRSACNGVSCVNRQCDDLKKNVSFKKKKKLRKRRGETGNTAVRVHWFGAAELFVIPLRKQPQHPPPPPPNSDCHPCNGGVPWGLNCSQNTHTFMRRAQKLLGMIVRQPVIKMLFWRFSACYLGAVYWWCYHGNAGWTSSQHKDSDQGNAMFSQHCFRS